MTPIAAMLIISFILALSLPSACLLAPNNRSGDTLVTSEGIQFIEAFATAAEVLSPDTVPSFTASQILFNTVFAIHANVWAPPAQVLIPSTTPSFHTTATPPSTKDTSTGSIDGEMTTPSVQSHTMQSTPAVAKGSSATPQPTSGTIELSPGLPSRKAAPNPLTGTNELHLELHNSKATPAYGTSTPMPSLPIETQPGLIFGTRSITPDIKSQYILSASQPFSLTLGSGTSRTTSALQTSGTQTLLDSSSSVLPPSPTADSLSQYSINSQTLTPSGVVTFSGTAVTLAASASGNVVEKSTKASSSIATQAGSVSKGTEVQKFTGNALGVRDELWPLWMVLLMGIALLLWL